MGSQKRKRRLAKLNRGQCPACKGTGAAIANGRHRPCPKCQGSGKNGTTGEK